MARMVWDKQPASGRPWNKIQCKSSPFLDALASLESLIPLRGHKFFVRYRINLVDRIFNLINLQPYNLTNYTTRQRQKDEMAKEQIGKKSKRLWYIGFWSNISPTRSL